MITGDLWPRFPAVPKMSDDGELVELDQLEEGGQVANLQSPDNNLSDDSDDDVIIIDDGSDNDDNSKCLIGNPSDQITRIESENNLNIDDSDNSNFDYSDETSDTDTFEDDDEPPYWWWWFT